MDVGWTEQPMQHYRVDPVQGLELQETAVCTAVLGGGD